jgi:hypothetical protein
MVSSVSEAALEHHQGLVWTKNVTSAVRVSGIDILLPHSRYYNPEDVNVNPHYIISWPWRQRQLRNVGQWHNRLRIFHVTKSPSKLVNRNTYLFVGFKNVKPSQFSATSAQPDYIVMIYNTDFEPLFASHWWFGHKIRSSHPSKMYLCTYTRECQ